MQELTPRQIVAALDRHIIGQDAAKRAVAIALRNRWRWARLPEEIRREVTPKNIIMIGPTGVGKTEITRRLAGLTGAPFIKVEATKYTEVGYYGRDVESMVRDLVDAAINLVTNQKREELREKVAGRVEQRLLDQLAPAQEIGGNTPEEIEAARQRHERTRQKFREMLQAGQLEDREVEVSVEQGRGVHVFSPMGMEHMDLDLQGMFDKLIPKQRRQRKVTVREARRIIADQEAEAMMDKDALHDEAVRLAERSGMIFIDEIDKITGSEQGTRSADVSRQGVQRDLLPIVEGTTVQTRYGPVRTEHMLFIAAGAFHRSKPSDLMPELQGRFPIRVELTDLTKQDFVRILTEPTGSLTRQYAALLKADGVDVEFTADGVDALADMAYQVNQTTQNIGARRLYTIMERLLEDVSFDAPDGSETRLVVNAEYVRRQLKPVAEDEDLSKFIL
jgi:ATP-dependent HslUV protease ATP-binding subunit HslU